jgi:divinyl chlorophyllide a 8-vinyl-reductase
MAYSTIQDLHKRKDQEQAIVRSLIKKALATEDITYTTGKVGRGSGQHVLVLGGTGYIGRALVAELAERGYKPVMLARHAQAKEAYPHAEVVIGEVSQKSDVEKAFDAFPVEAVITLLSSRRPNDEEECRRVDYQSNINAIQVGAAKGLKHFIHISDSGCYRPELLPQVYKLQVEGELIGHFHGPVNYSIVRPTSYYPHLAINFSEVQNDRPCRIFDHGEWAVSNPISRENLSEFIVNLLFNEQHYGRVFPVGGPWVEDNICTLKRANELIFQVLGKPEKFMIISMKSRERRIRIIKAVSMVLPMFKRMAFYLEAAKYWSVVSHFAPPYGKDTFKEYLIKLKASGYSAGSMRDRMKSGTSMIPTHV